ncbi:lysophospholipid acyltransferase family protein [Deinococcus malanensis]|uniref:lysophospholipid acyltransferase family protein n=1 Tax=Deinococcus malanensis TaxID=1706855 RepID=UPI00362E655A
MTPTVPAALFPPCQGPHRAPKGHLLSILPFTGWSWGYESAGAAQRHASGSARHRACAAPGTPLVIASNHRSALDPFLVARALPPGRFVQFMAKQELFLPVIGAIIRAGGSFPVDRSSNDVQAIRTALRILAANGTVGIFPEGTRGGSGGELHGGVALIAAKGRAPILPAGISRSGKRWVIRFGSPISPKGGIKAVTRELGTVLAELARPV